MKNGRTYLGVILCALLLSVVAAHAQKPQEGPPATPPAGHDSYVIGESDVLAINVWHEPELTRVIPVRTDGKITLPLIGELQASGQTVEQLRATIASQLKRFLEDPEVTVIVQEPRSQFFTVVGKVQEAGLLSVGAATDRDGRSRSQRRLQGFRQRWVKSGLSAPTATGGRAASVQLQIAAGGDLNQNFPLEPHDMIHCPVAPLGIDHFALYIRLGGVAFMKLSSMFALVLCLCLTTVAFAQDAQEGPKPGDSRTERPAHLGAEAPPLAMGTDIETGNVLVAGFSVGAAYDSRGLYTGGVSPSYSGDTRYFLQPSIGYQRTFSEGVWTLSYTPGVSFSQHDLESTEYTNNLAGDVELGTPIRVFNLHARQDFSLTDNPFEDGGAAWICCPG